MTIEDDITFFERVPTLGLLGQAALRILAIGAETRHVHRGDVLFRAGEPADAGYVIQQGSLRLSISDTDKNAVTVGVGTLLGEMALLIDTTRPVTATAVEPSTVLRIPRSLFLKMLEGYPDAAGRLLDIITRRTNEAARDITSVRDALDVPPSR
jgi:CRP-like cAMP-binding protein